MQLADRALKADRPRTQISDVSWALLAGAGAGLLGAVVALTPIWLGGTAVLVLGAVVVPFFVLRIRPGWGWVPLTMTGSAVLLPLLTVAGRPADNYFAVAATAVAAVCLLSGSRRDHMPVMLLVGLGILGATSVLSAAGNRPDDAAVALRFASYGILAIVLVQLDERQRIFAQRAALVLALVLAASVYLTYSGLVTLRLYADAEAEGFRVGGLIGHPNFAAYFLGLVVLAQLVLPGFRGPRWPATVAVLAGAILLTGSRGAALWLVVAAMAGFRYWWRQSPVLLVLAGTILVVPGSLLIDRFASLQASGGVTGQNAAGWRVGQWRRALALQDEVGATGLGWTRAQDLLPGGLGVHNGYLQVFVELGLLGVLGLTVVVAALLLASRAANVPLAIMIFMAGTTLSDPVLLYPPITYLLLVLLYTSAAPKLPRSNRTDGLLDAPATT